MSNIDQRRAATHTKAVLAFHVAPGIATSIRWLNDAPAPGLSVTAAAGSAGIAIKGTATGDGVLQVSVNDRSARMEIAAGENAAAVARAIDATVRAAWPGLAAPASVEHDQVQVVHICRRGDVVGAALVPASPAAPRDDTTFGNMKSDAIERTLRERFPPDRATVGSVDRAFALLMDNSTSILDEGVMRFLVDAIPRAISNALTSDPSYGRASVDRFRRKVIDEIECAPTDASADQRKALLAPFSP